MKDETTRPLEWILTTDRITSLVDKYLLTKILLLKGHEPPARLRLVARNPNGTVEMHSPTELDVGSPVVLFRILGRYIEIHGTVLVKKEGDIYSIRLDKVGLAMKDRGNMRLPVEPTDVWITNIQTSKYLIDTSTSTIPTTVKVTFSEYERVLQNEFEIVKIDVFGVRGTLLDEIRRSGKTLFVADTWNPGTYVHDDPFLFDFKKYLGPNLQKQIFDYRNRKIRAEAIVPVVYVTHDRSEIPIGYVQVQSKTSPMNQQTLDRLREISEEMIEKIRRSNTVYVKERETVLNLSMGGMRVSFKNRDLAQHLLRQSGFTFDVLFRGQAPITVYGLIRSAAKASDGQLICGVEIGGFTDDTNGRSRYESNIRTMEKRVQAQAQAQASTQRR